MSTEPLTAIVDVIVTTSLEIDEPGWCVGHRGDRAQYKADITHFGPEHVIAANGYAVLRAMLSQSPYGEHSPRNISLYVEESDLSGSYTPDEVEQLADALADSAEQLRALGRELAAILAGGGQ
ncbi:DUF6907 domain-containing protein [Streptomyces sp. NPDC001221]